MYLAIVSLEHVGRLTARRFLMQYLSGTRIVLSKHILSFLRSPERFEKHLFSLEARPVNRKDPNFRK